MAFLIKNDSKPRKSLEEMLSEITDDYLLSHYFPDIKHIPIHISSPYREDKHPSMRLYFNQKDNKIFFKDFSNGDCGSLLVLLSKIWGISFINAVERVYENINPDSITVNVGTSKIRKSNGINLQVTEREWLEYDFDYWESYGVSKEILLKTQIKPISHYFYLFDDGSRKMYIADKYAYCYVEFIDNKARFKIYQPYNTNGNKWRNNYSSDVFSLYYMLPKEYYLCALCSSVKDALCLTSQLNIPAISPQGEGYNIPQHIIYDLNKRFGKVVIFYDNDNAGIEYAKKVSEQTGWDYIVLEDKNAKDISDTFKAYGKEKFKEIITKLFLDKWIILQT